MLTFKREKINDREVTYRYYPENGKEYGRITMSLDAELLNKECSKEDTFEWYAGHMMSKMRDMIANSDFQEDGMIAWY